MNNAKSFVNRHKDFRLDNLLPHEKNVILQMDGKHFSPYQLYLWQWCELELRALQFLSSEIFQDVMNYTILISMIPRKYATC